MLKRLSLLLLLSAGLATGQATAQCTPETAGRQSPGPNAPAFSEFDLDGDGVITSAEYYQARSARMARRAQEGAKMKNAGNMPAFESIDLDGDGSLSEDEFAAHHRHHGRHQGRQE